MKPLDNMTFAQRFALTVVIVLAILFALALFGFMTGRWDAADAAPALETMKYEDRFIELDRVAIERAYSDHVVLLYKTWMTDPSSNSQPARAVYGANLARKNYAAAMTAIEVREAAHKAAK
jgi:hypothetical protein